MRPDLGAFFKNADGQFAARVIGKLFQPDRGGKAGRAAADNDHIIWHRFTFRHSNPPSPFRTNCRAHPSFRQRSEEHTSELQSLMRISYAVFCLKKKNKNKHQKEETIHYQNKTIIRIPTDSHKHVYNTKT